MAHRTEDPHEPTKAVERVAADELQSRLTDELPGFLNDRLNERGQAISFREHGVDVHAEDGTDHESSVRLLSVRVNDVERVEVHDVQFDDGLGGRSAAVKLRLFGSIVGLLVRHHSDAPDEDDDPTTRSYSNDFLDVDAEVRWDGQWNLTSVIATGTATITVVPQHSFLEKYERWVVGRI
jgi:hypothetical protein